MLLPFQKLHTEIICSQNEILYSSKTKKVNHQFYGDSTEVFRMDIRWLLLSSKNNYFLSFFFYSLTSVFTPRGSELKNGQLVRGRFGDDMKPVTFNLPWTAEEQVCLVFHMGMGMGQAGKSL